MDLRARLSQRMHIGDIKEILHFIQDDGQLREELYQYVFDKDDFLSYQALWVCTHFPDKDIAWLSHRQDKLIDVLTTCRHTGKRRLLLNLLSRQPAGNPPRMDLLDFCLQRIITRQEPDGVKSLCIKLAHRLTRSIPELQQELYAMLEIMEPELLSPSIRAVRKNTLKAMRTGK